LRPAPPLVALVAAVLAAPAPAPAAPAPAASVEEALREHRGRVVVVNFWAVWCAPCRTELPLLARLQREYESRGVQFVGASTDPPEAQKDAMALAARSGVAYPVLFGLTEESLRSLGMGSLLPATAVYDRDGTRAFRVIGQVTGRILVERLDWLLGPRGGRPPRPLALPAGVDAGEYED